MLWTEDWPVKDRKEEQEAERWRSCSIICNKKAASSSVAAVIWKKNQVESCGKNRLCEEIFLQVKKKDRGEKRAAPIGSSCVYTAEYVAVVEEWKYRREKKISKNYFSWFFFLTDGVFVRTTRWFRIKIFVSFWAWFLICSLFIYNCFSSFLKKNVCGLYHKIGHSVRCCRLRARGIVFLWN